MKHFEGQQFISLQDASKHCHYSQEYLSLRARQKKLHAVKLGRNWFTTKEWLGVYIQEAEGYKEKAVLKKYENAQAQREYAKKLFEPPANLPVEDLLPTPNSLTDLVAKKISIAELLKVTSAFAVVLVLLGFTSALSRDTFQEVSEDVYPVVQPIVQETVASATPYISSMPHLPEVSFPVQRYVSSSVGDIGNAYVKWFSDNLSSMATGIVQQVRGAHESIVQAIRSLGEKFGSQFVQRDQEPIHGETIPGDMKTPGKKGLVVVPSTEKDEEVKERVQRSFSDEVVVAPHDEASGIITPVFRERDGEDYLYILVPLQE